MYNIGGTKKNIRIKQLSNSNGEIIHYRVISGHRLNISYGISCRDLAESQPLVSVTLGSDTPSQILPSQSPAGFDQHFTEN